MFQCFYTYTHGKSKKLQNKVVNESKMSGPDVVYLQLLSITYHTQLVVHTCLPGCTKTQYIVCGHTTECPSTPTIS